MQPPPVQNSNLPVPPQGHDDDDPSIFRVLGGVVLKVAAVSITALSIIYPIIAISKQLSPAKGYTAWNIVKFTGLSMGVGALTSLICLVVALRFGGEIE